jgi:hypothetical protein
VVRREPSRVARWAAALPGPSGVSLGDELDRVVPNDPVGRLVAA